MTEEAFMWRLRRLHIERGIYSPHVLPPGVSSWRSLFIQMRKLRCFWDGEHKNEVVNQSPASFRVSVCARFRPKRLNNNFTINKSGNTKKVTLPLHQRLSLIKIANNLSNNKDALKLLSQEGEWFNTKEKYLEEKKNDSDGSEDEQVKLTGGVHTVDYDNNSIIIVDPIKGLFEIRLDHIFRDSCSQKAVYETSCMRLVTDFMNGYNASCLVYGQTGSGKTYTMFGEDDFSFTESIDSCLNKDRWGIVPRACFEVFQAISYRRKKLNFSIDSSLNITYVEVFGDTVLDLLRKGSPCGHSRVSAQRFVLDGSSEVPVNSFAEVLTLLNEGGKQKRKATTAMNERSSRAHTIVILTLRQSCPTRKIRMISRLFLVDLGGCEQLKKSEIKIDSQGVASEGIQQNMERSAELQSMQNDRVKEAVNINLGLLALKQCVEKLNRNSKYIPYADSKLTMLLSPGLGGNSKTAMIICAGQEKEHSSETVNAIKFGRTCRKIKKSMICDETKMIKDIIRRIDNEIDECEENIKRRERWRIIEKSRIDASGELEIKKTTILTGAEDDRARLEDLLRKKAELTGFYCKENKKQC